jgi:amino acid adenylation domain-containing protein
MPHQISSPPSILTTQSPAFAEQPSRAGQTITRGFEQMATARPDSVALVFGLEQITYEALNRRANQLARYLRQLNLDSSSAGPFVAIYLDRSPGLIVAILAVLKAGWAYLPIDSRYPPTRALEMVEDARPIAILSAESLIPRLADDLRFSLAPVISIDKLESELASQSCNNLPPSSDPDSLAYLMYTSGSTGKPKGVMVTHRNVIRLLEQTHPWFGFNNQDVWTLFHSVAFDFSVWEIWGCLLTGGKLVIVTFETSRSPSDFRELLLSEGVTVLNQTPSAFSLLLQAEVSCTSKLDHLRFIIFGGERLEYSMLQPWFRRYDDTSPQLINMYGITETTVHVTYRQVTKFDAESAHESLIGVPIPDLQLHILDDSGNQVPIGGIGEIYVGGAGVTNGYLNRPELNRDRFVSNPLTPTSTARLYKTGDLARVRPDGEIVYLGRNDSQVKINGFRIELGEIECALAKVEGVAQCAATAIQDRSGTPALAVYYVVTPGSSHSPSSLGKHLSQVLPAHMRPSFYVQLDALPLTSNGKLDRAVLPRPAIAPVDASLLTSRQNLSDTETVVNKIWCDLLGAIAVDCDANLFDIGATSLLFIQAHTRIRTTLNLQFSITWMFEYPTVRSLATRLSTIDISAPSADRHQTRAQQQRGAFARVRMARSGI